MVPVAETVIKQNNGIRRIVVVTLAAWTGIDYREAR
jgi:hypothetical protein